MKTLSIAAALLFFPMLHAQNNSEFSTTTKLKGEVFFGHSLLGRGTALGTEGSYDNMSKVISEKPLYGSAGNGTVFGANFNYFPVDYFGIGVGFSHLSGNWQTIDKSTYTDGYSSMEEFRGNYNNLSMDVIIRTCCQGQWHGQASFGPSFFPGSNTEFKELRGMNGATDYDIRRTITNRAGFGLNAGFGGDFQLTDHIAIGVDFRSTIFNATGKTESYTKYSDKGVDKLAGMNTYNKETEYVNEITQSSNQSGLSGYDKNKPYNDLAPKTNFNNFVGVIRTTFTF